ncbi:heavy-metal-associated domain-containing protein [Nitrosophilus kaiyonis]|uniref:heavy-metal-associated domain-containing protein n=1 Tax=Nitrosophilus kaiyonis TaxID=2930200 RepID=UPI0024911F64|nr:heavy-metal-associated domain-containing protein [Nitrosophilus kaiyonis]
MKKSFETLNIKCEGCANSIKKALSSYFDFIEIDLSKEPRIVTVDIKNQDDEEKLKTILRGLGYPLINDRLTKTQEIGLKTKSFISCAVGKFTLD